MYEVVSKSWDFKSCYSQIVPLFEWSYQTFNKQDLEKWKAL